MPGSAFPPIAEYGFLSDCYTSALVAADSAVEWLSLPRFDSPSAFGAMLDRDAGSFRFMPAGVLVPLDRRYIPGTLVLETTWTTGKAWLVVRDALAIGEWSEHWDVDGSHRPRTAHDTDQCLVRVATCIAGELDMRVICRPSFQYGAEPAHWQDGPRGEQHASGGDQFLSFATDLEVKMSGDHVAGTLHLREGESCYAAICWDPESAPPHSAPQALERITSTEEYWRSWLRHGRFPDHPWRIHLQRSAVVLKGLTYAPTGAIVAAPTTSLPETPGGERNWDYRYCWIRDSTFSLWALHTLGFDEEARDFAHFITHTIHEGAREDGRKLQIMYGVGGEWDLTEKTLDHLSGYDGAKPVRIGNGAFSQRQNDVWGALLDSVYIHSKTIERLGDDAWELICEAVEAAIEAWPLPDQGIWEARGDPKHYVSSKLMIWVALNRGARLARNRGEDERAAGWEDVADRVKAEILDRGVRDGIFRQHYETDALDASTLLVPLVRFLPPDDERIRKTVMAIGGQLTQHGLVLRYLVEDTDDGLHGAEGTFLICSFWLVSALSEIGERVRAREYCERLLLMAGPLDLYAEELDAASGKHLGNYPQAFTHLALINAVSHVIADSWRGEEAVPTAVFSEMRTA